MTITIDRKRKNSIDIFPSIDDFIIFLKRNYNNINFNDFTIKSSIESIYNSLLHDDDNVPLLRLTRWLPRKFGFRHSNKFSLPFWIERGFTHLDYVNYSESIFRERGERLSKHAKGIKRSSYVYDKDYSIIYLYNTTRFESEQRPKCNLCKGDLVLKKSVIDHTKLYLIQGCSNNSCGTTAPSNKDTRWLSFLPQENYLQLKSNLKAPKRAFSKDFWTKRGFTEEEAIKKVSQIQSNNSKKFRGKRTGKDKNVLRLKGYNEEQIREVCLSPLNIDFWIKKGHTPEESKSIISKKQSHAAKFVNFKDRILPSNPNYWINRGHSEEESKKLVSHSQTTFSKKICIEKWGDEKGIEIFNQRTKKWLASLKSNNNIFIGHSKISQELFNQISNRLAGDFKYALQGGEFKIERENGGFYFYDFADLHNKLIIEYNGDMYHANPDVYSENDHPHPFRKEITSGEIWEKDRLKFETAQKLGYKLLTIWDSEYRYKGFRNKEIIVERCINFLLNRQ